MDPICINHKTAAFDPQAWLHELVRPEMQAAFVAIQQGRGSLARGPSVALPAIPYVVMKAT